MIISEEKKTITRAEDIAEIMRDILQSENEIDQMKEHLWAIGLSASNRIEYIELCNLGILNNCNTHPREVFRLAIMKAVNSIIMVHNHPSGEMAPSSSDQKVTQQMKDAGEIIGINLLDHIIINESEFFSFQGQGIL